MPPPLIFHLGPHKTGTTMLQQGFARRRGRLKAAGLMYPLIGRSDGMIAHHALARDPGGYLREPGPRRAGLVHLGRRARRHGFGLLLSSETFWAWPPEAFRQAAELTGLRPVLLCVIRDPVARAVSYWAEEVKHGATQSLAERLAPLLADPLGAPLLNIAPRLAEWRAAGLELRPVPWRAAGPMGLFARVWEDGLGLSDPPPAPAGRPNTRLPPEVTEMMRWANRTWPESRATDLRDHLARGLPAPALVALAARLREGLPPPDILTCPADGPCRSGLDAALREVLEGCSAGEAAPGEALEVAYWSDDTLHRARAAALFEAEAPRPRLAA